MEPVKEATPIGPGPATVLLHRVAGGDRDAEVELYGLVEAELRRMAGRELRGQHGDHTLQPTALVNEAWIRLAASAADGLNGRGHFLAVAARAMRCILVDHARKRNAAKRGGARERVPFEDALAVLEDRTGDLVEVDAALERLARDRPRQAQVVELRFFGGLTAEETAGVLGIGRATVMRDWHLARIRLRAELA